MTDLSLEYECSELDSGHVLAVVALTAEREILVSHIATSNEVFILLLID